MAATAYPRRQPSSSASDSDSQRSYASYTSNSTAPTSVSESPRPSHHHKQYPQSTTTTTTTTTSSSSARYASNDNYYSYENKARYVYDSRDDVSPSTYISPRSTDYTYASTNSSQEDLDLNDSFDYDCGDIPPLPVYHHAPVEPSIRIPSPQDFAKLFPSLNRLTVRHDECSEDGNMQLRVDTVITGSRRRVAYQLFHLRMYDLHRRQFSLRRYHRGSGREVCNSKLKFIEPPVPKERDEEARPVTAPGPIDAKPTLRRTMSTALWSLSGKKPTLRRAWSDGSADAAPRRPSTSHSNWSSRLSLDSRLLTKAPPRPVPTNTLKLEFSNYARVDLTRRGTKGKKRYEFEWWGHNYAWRRSVDKQLGTVSFHLIRDDNSSAPVAHIVPETRSPSQVTADEAAGGWIPPCFMWIADESVINAATDVADVIMATGLMALVDDCIREKWQKPAAAAAKERRKSHHHIPLPFLSSSVPEAGSSPKSFFLHQVFSGRFLRRNSNEPASRPTSIYDPSSRPVTPAIPSPLRANPWTARAVAA